MSASWLQRTRRRGRITLRFTLFAGFAATMVLRLVFNRRHRRTLLDRARWLQAGCRGALRILGVNATSIGEPPAGAIVVANHLGYVDVLLLAATTPVVFVAKREVAGWPVFGWFARMAGTRFIDRRHRADVVRVAKELAAPLAEGVSVVLFLEGTSSDGRRVLPFKSSLLEPAVRHAWTVTPAAMAFRVPAGHSAADEVCWWGEMTLLPHLGNLAGLRWVDARVSWGKPVAIEGDRKELATELRARIVALLATLQDRMGETAEPASADATGPALAEVSA